MRACSVACVHRAGPQGSHQSANAALALVHHLRQVRLLKRNTTCSSLCILRNRAVELLRKLRVLYTTVRLDQCRKPLHSPQPQTVSACDDAALRSHVNSCLLDAERPACAASELKAARTVTPSSWHRKVARRATASLGCSCCDPFGLLPACAPSARPQAENMASMAAALSLSKYVTVRAARSRVTFAKPNRRRHVSTGRFRAPRTYLVVPSRCARSMCQVGFKRRVTRCAASL